MKLVSRVKSHSRTVVCITRSKTNLNNGKFHNGSLQFNFHDGVAIIHSMHMLDGCPLEGWKKKLRIISAEMSKLAYQLGLKNQPTYVVKTLLEPLSSTSTATVSAFYGKGKKDNDMVAFFGISSCIHAVRLLISLIGINKSIGILNSMVKEIDTHIEFLNTLELSCD